MATIKNYTDIPQSETLNKILPLESADMYWWSSSKRYYIEPMYIGDFYEEKGHIRAWSLSALLDILPFPHLSKDKLGSGKVGWMVSVYPDNCRYDSCWYENPIDACVNMIVRLHKMNLL